MSSSAEPLVLWDIDGTLVNTAGLGRDAFADAFGIEQGERHLPEFTDALAIALAAKESEIRAKGHAMPGAAEVLAALEGRATQSLLTGNIEPNAALKLAAFGLGAELDFEIGAYGSDHRVRPELVGIALRKARAKHGKDFHPVLVGDTPLDIAAARGGGAAVVAVATGPHSVEELAGADAVLPDLRDTAAAVEAILTARASRSG